MNKRQRKKHSAKGHKKLRWTKRRINLLAKRIEANGGYYYISSCGTIYGGEVNKCVP